MLSHQLPILQVVIPLLAAPLCFLLSNGRIAWLFTTLVSVITFVVSILLVVQIHNVGILSYALGGWPPPWGIAYHIDHLSAYVLIIVSFIACLTLFAGRESIENEIPSEKLGIFYSAFLLCITGLLGIVATGDAFNIFVFLEISSLSSYALIAMGQDRRSLTASYQYLIMGTIGATMILIGIGLLYMLTGTLNILDLQSKVPALIESRTLHAAFAFFTVGISLKMALFPLHLWLPNAYAFAPSMVTVFLSATATKVSLYVLFRFFFGLFSDEISFGHFFLDKILLPLSVIAILTASFVAIFQDNIKRMFAYSSVAQIGYMTLGIGLGTSSGSAAGLLHLFNHAIIKGGIFMAIACVVLKVKSAQLEDFTGLGRKMPWTMAAIVMLGLGLIGVPFTAGFISKWYLLLATIEQRHWIAAFVVVGGSLLAILYVWKIIEFAYLKTPEHEFKGAPEENIEAPVQILIPLWILVTASIYFGLETSFSYGFANTAITNLFN